MRRARILMVEDEREVLLANGRHLENQGYTVDCAETLSQARVFLQNNIPDLILLDVLLPDGSGYDFCEEIRDKTSAHIIYLTCMDRDENIVNGLSLGGDDYITKPYSLDVLSARVMAGLRRTSAAGLGTINLPPLFINLQRSEVALEGAQIELTPKELQLLAFFASNIGKRFSAEDIYRIVWTEAKGIDTQTVRKHISALRRKLNLGDDSPFEFRSVKNEGYIFSRLYEE